MAYSLLKIAQKHRTIPHELNSLYFLQLLFLFMLNNSMECNKYEHVAHSLNTKKKKKSSSPLSTNDYMAKYVALHNFIIILH